jgi:hypothetical protein
MFCTNHLQLEVHCCVGLEDVKKAELKNLENNLPKVIASKVIKF